MDKKNTWKLVYSRFEPDEEGLREALCTLANGYFGTRGAAPETAPTETHYPGTYIAGVYNRLATHIAGRIIYNEDLVNCPNWTYLTFRIRDEAWFSPSTTKILSYHQELNMRQGIFYRKILCQSRHGRKTWVQETRIVHMGDPHVGAIKYVITPVNYSDYLSIRSMLDGGVLNMNVERYRQLNFHHWRAHVLGKFSKNGVYLGVKASQSKIEVYEAAKLRVFLNKKEINPRFEFIHHGKKVVGQEFRVFVKKRQPAQIEKTVTIFTSRDQGIKNPKIEAIRQAENLPRFDRLFYSHKQLWNKLWDKCDITIQGDSFSQKVLRLHIFHLLQTASIHNTKIDAGFPARGLHGEAYRGHIFWDEIFILPFFNTHLPEVSKALLLYRYRRLHRAREYARKNGYRGSMFPWQSGSTGREETQIVHLNPRSGKWGPDYSRHQRHVSLAIAYNIWNYWKMTNDLDFLERYGAELLLSIARFGASLTKYDSKDGRFHIEHIMGPDEFHEKLPKNSRSGLKDNAYTNVMVVWTLLRAQEVLSIISNQSKLKLMKRLRLTCQELEHWDKITRKMKIIFNDHEIISQFKGYFKLKELDWQKYRKKYKSIHRLDRILKAEGKSPDNYKVAKQADVLMLFYLLKLDEVQGIFNRLGYFCDKKLLKKNYDYYIKRTSHGSTLSKVVHCFISQLVDKHGALCSWFYEVLKSDIYDTQGGTTPEGIHAGVMGGSVDIVVRSFAGIQIEGRCVNIQPYLPNKWRRIKLKLCYRKNWLTFDITKSKIKISLKGSRSILKKLSIKVKNKNYSLVQGKAIVINL